MKFLKNLSWSKIFTNRTCFSLVMSSSVAINGEAWRKSSLWTLTDTLSLQMNRRSLSLSLFRMKDRLRLMSWKCKILKLMYLLKISNFERIKGQFSKGLTIWISTHFLLGIIEHKFTKLFLHHWNSSLQRKYELMLKVKFSVCVLTRFFDLEFCCFPANSADKINQLVLNNKKWPIFFQKKSN